MNLPATTKFDKRIPKQKFYANLSVTPELRRLFIDQINLIVWVNKLAPTTMNIAPGNTVTELEVFEMRLNQPRIDLRILQLIDKEIPYHILFLLRCDDKCQLWIGYKEAALAGKNAFKVSAYYHTEWLPEQQLDLRVSGLNMDDVYEGFVRQIAGDKLHGAGTQPGTLGEAVQQAENRAKLKQQIEKLEKQAWAEHQPKKKFELAQQIAKLKKEMEA